MKQPSEKLERAKSCIDQIVKDWNRTNLSDLEKWSMEEFIIWGAVHMALYMLSNDDYQELKEYIYQEYGYNIGGTSGDMYEREVIE